MTQEQKDLLLRDLCGRLPYGVICKSVNFRDPTKLVSIDLDGPSHDVFFCTNDGGSMWNDYDDIKPYLFPLSSMTKEQKKEYVNLLVRTSSIERIQITGESTYDWLNKNMFDWRGLIPSGLAEDATGKNIY